jgi:hypothetical protein
VGLASLKADVRRLLIGVKDLHQAFTESETCTAEESARGACLIWRYLNHHHPGDDLDDGLELVRWYEGLPAPTAEETRRFRRLICEAWNQMAPGRGAPVCPRPPDPEAGADRGAARRGPHPPTTSPEDDA